MKEVSFPFHYQEMEGKKKFLKRKEKKKTFILTIKSPSGVRSQTQRTVFVLQLSANWEHSKNCFHVNQKPG